LRLLLERLLAQVAQRDITLQVLVLQVAQAALLATIRRPLVRLQPARQRAQRGPIQRRERPHARVALQEHHQVQGLPLAHL